MTGLPGWLGGYAVADNALAVLANRGLVRRAAKETDRLELVTASAAGVELAYRGIPPAVVTLLPGGPKAARCGCPVAGVCVHIVAACVWARNQAAGGPPIEPAQATADVVAELLALDPATVNRRAGVAAVRRVAAGIAPTPTTITGDHTAVRVTWPGSPEVVAVAGGGFAGMLVAGRHSDVEDRALRLEAVVRVFATAARSWPWPERVAAVDAVQPGQLEALGVARRAIEALLVSGLSRVGADGVGRLRAASQRARLEALPLLGILLTGAAGRASAVAGREDDTSERDLLEALARAWALAGALSSAGAPLPATLVGSRSGHGESVEVGVLVPLGVRWWLAPSGARGLTVTLWDSTNRRLETASTGRAAGADPSFQRSWNSPLLWGASAQSLCAGVFTLIDAERRDDGSISPTTRTRVSFGPRFRDAAPELDQLARAIGEAASGPGAIGFQARPADVRLVLPRRLLGIGQPELDEVNQQVIWPMVDRSGVRHRVRMEAAGVEQGVVEAILQAGTQISAVVLDGNDRPLSVFTLDRGRTELIAPSLTPPKQQPRGGRPARRPKPQRPRAFDSSRPATIPPLAELADAVLDVCEALASTGRPTLSGWQRDALTRRTQQATDLGLLSLAAAVRPLLEQQPVAPPAVLRATLVAGRARTLAAATSG